MVFAKKSLGQNFLMHAQTATRIVAAAEVQQGTLVLEIGPGTGMMTRELLKAGYRVLAVEADRELIPVLSETFKEEITSGALTLVHEDIRRFDPSSIGQAYALVANIPYYLTGEIMRQFLSAAHKPSSITVLVQKEVAERIARSEKGSVLSIAVAVYGVPRYCFTVPRGAFLPAPNVDSAVLSIRGIRDDTFASPAQERQFFDILHAGFAHKRKLLLKNLTDIAPLEQVSTAFAAANLPEKARAEDLSAGQWRQLAGLLAPVA